MDSVAHAHIFFLLITTKIMILPTKTHHHNKCELIQFVSHNRLVNPHPPAKGKQSCKRTMTDSNWKPAPLKERQQQKWNRVLKMRQQQK